MIRAGRLTDCKAAREIAREVGFLSWANYSLDGWVRNPKTVFIVTEEQGEIVGFLLSRVTVDEAELLVLAVKEQHRNNGYASQMVDLLNRRLRIKNIDKVFLEVDTENKTAIKLYKNNGYENVGLRKNYYDGRRDAYIMELELKK